jgi:hypothetical protein
LTRSVFMRVRALVVALAGVAVLASTSCAGEVTSGCPDIAGPTQGVTLLDPNPWLQAHPGDRMQVCLVGQCGRAGEFGAFVHDAGPHKFIARGYSRSGRLLTTSTLLVRFRYEQNPCGQPAVWTGGDLYVDRTGRLLKYVPPVSSPVDPYGP